MEEKRKLQRFPIELEATYIDPDDKQSKHCKVVEISQEGIRLSVKEKIKFGRSVALEIQIPTQDTAVGAEVLIRWNKELYGTASEFNFLAGGEFKTIDSQARQTLLDYSQSR